MTLSVALCLLLLVAPVSAAPGDTTEKLVIAVSGTVKPIHERVAAQLAPRFPDLQIEFVAAGSTDGFLRLAEGSADVIGASRSIRADEVTRIGAEAFVELPIALDGIVIIVPASNHWVDFLTFDELGRLWSGEAATWADVRDSWPAEPIARHTYGPASGTVASLLTILDLPELAADRTTHSVTAELLADVASSRHGVGQVGLAALMSTDLPLRAVSIDLGDGPVMPSYETLRSAEYPLARQLWLYVARPALDRPEVARYLDAYLTTAPAVVEEVGFAALPPHIQDQVLVRLESKTTGSVLEGGMSRAVETYGSPTSDH